MKFLVRWSEVEDGSVESCYEEFTSRKKVEAHINEVAKRPTYIKKSLRVFHGQEIPIEEKK